MHLSTKLNRLELFGYPMEIRQDLTKEDCRTCYIGSGITIFRDSVPQSVMTPRVPLLELRT